MDKENRLNESCVSCLLAILVGLILNSLVLGYVVSNLWLWFLVPLGIPAIGIFHSLGIVSVVNIFLSSSYFMMSMKQNKDDLHPIVEKYSYLFLSIGYLAALLIGYIIHLLMVAYPA